MVIECLLLFCDIDFPIGGLEPRIYNLMIEGWSGGPPPEKSLVIFIQNVAILGNINGYMCHNKRVGFPF